MNMRFPLIPVTVLVLSVFAGPLRAAGPVTTVLLRNPADQPVKSVPVSFGQVFRKGDVKQGVVVKAGGAVGQADVKRKHDDGSVRFAVISLVVPSLPAHGELAVELSDGVPRAPARAVSPIGLLETEFDATVRLSFPDGTERSASARNLIRDSGADTKIWLRGPVCTELLLDGPPVDKDGVPDPDLNVQFQVRFYEGAAVARVSAVVENCWDTWAGNIGYDVTVDTAGKTAYEKRGVNHSRLSRWRKTFWWPAEPPAVDVIHDLQYLSDSGALPHYDRTLKVSAPKQPPSGANFEIMGSGSLTRYMPTTGGRPEIGPYPQWAVRYLLTMSPAARELVLANGDLAGSWPIHVRNRKTRRVMTIDERPSFWFFGYRDDHGYQRPHWQPDRKKPLPPQDSKGQWNALTPDIAHMGSFAYIPYLVTGDYYYLEEAYFWATYTLLGQWNAPRQGARGLMADQVRGNAWGLRNIADAAFIAAEGDPESKHFAEKIHNNMAAWTARMYGPESNGLGFDHWRTTADARIVDPANPRWLVMVWWEHDYLIWSLHHLTELGFTDAAKPRDFLLRWRVGSFLHPDQFDPRMSAPYRIVVGESVPGGKPIFYEDWKKLSEENIRFGNKPELPTYGSSYSYTARMAVACAVDAKFPGADNALKIFENLLPDWHQQLTTDPTFAVSPRKTRE
jgi:hypothetical protein